jgi:phage shock protein C
MVLMEEKRITRPRKARIIAGVCSGIGRYFDIDPNIVRVIWIILTFMSIGLGVIAYIAAWLLFPEESEKKRDAGEE